MAQIRVIKPEDNEPRCRVCQASNIVCQEQGFVHVISSKKKNISYLDLCPNLLQVQKCDGKPPYYYLDEEAGVLRECPTRPMRLKLERIHQLIRDSNIPPKYRYRRISEFKTDFSDDDDITMSLFQAHDNAHHFIEQFSPTYDEKYMGLYFWGSAGSGKTMLACLILNELILQFQLPVKYIKITRDFFNRIRATFSQESEMYGKGESYFNMVAEAEVLVIDDFGVQADSEWEKRTLYDLIDARYENEKATIITSNLPPEDIETAFKSRIYSRLKEMTTFHHVLAFDYRENFQPDLS